MGILGLGSEILTEYKADASQHKRELQELKNFQSALGEEEGKRAAERNAHLTEWIEKLGKVTLAVVAVKEVSEFLWDGYKDGIKDARLATQAMGVDIEKLKEATKGLITENQLLEIAAKANKSAFHNSQEDIEAAGKAIVALEHRGATAAEAMDAVTKALVEGKTRGLEPYGIVVDKNLKGMEALGEENLTLAQKTEIHTAAMKQLKTVADEVSDSQDDVGDSMKRSQVKLADAWDDLKKELGKLVVAFQPIIEALAKVLGLITKVVDAVGDAYSDSKGLLKGAGMAMLGIDPNKGGYTVADAFAYQQQSVQQGAMFAKYGNVAADLGQRFSKYYVDPNDIQIDNYEWKADPEAAKKAAEAANLLVAKAILASAKDDTSFKSADAFMGALRNTDAANGMFRASAGGTNPYGTSALANPFGVASGAYDSGAGDATMAHLQKAEAFRQVTGTSFDELTKGQRDMINAADMKQVLQYAQEFLNQKTDSVLAKTFGPVGEFDLYKKGFESLTGAVGTMYEAVVSGSESGIGAFKKFIAAQVAAEGKLMMIEAVKEGAYAVGNLAYGNFAGAAAHAQAAAEFAAGAVLAGVVASELGYGGGGSSGGGPAKGGNGGGSGGGGSGGSGQSQTVIVYGDSFSEDTPRSRQIRASKIVAQALGTSGGKFS